MQQDAKENDIAAWQRVVEAGEAVFMPPFTELPIDWAALQADLANAYNTLGNAHDTAEDSEAALAAFDRAIALQPDFAMWHRNRAGTLIELGRLEEARGAIDQARALEPDAPRLQQLEEALAAALAQQREQQQGDAPPTN
jgi:tetratricopeptide (TPR) repeat protein